MTDPTSLEIHVSVQAAGRTVGWRAVHLAAGMLGDTDMALVPAPPPALLDPAQDFEVVTIPVPLGRYPIERLPGRCAHVLWLDGDRRTPVAAMVKLDRPSQYSRTMAPFSGPALAERLQATGGDLWESLESLGIVRRGLREGPPADVLAQVPEVERRQRALTYRDHDHRSAADIGFSLCRWLCICSPTGPGDGRTVLRNA